MESSTPTPTNYTPLAILGAGLMIAVAVVYIGTRAPQANTPIAVAPVAERANAPQEALKLALDEDDFIYGNPDAETFIIEYSDIDCPFCARVHPTLKEVVDESNGSVAWVYRQFPIEQLHPEAPFKAAASECVGQLAGNDAFWKYLDGLILGADTDTYAEYAVAQADFDACVQSAETASAIDNDMQRAIANGGGGTPFSIVATREHGLALNGALPKAAWTQAITAVTNN